MIPVPTLYHQSESIEIVTYNLCIEIERKVRYAVVPNQKNYVICRTAHVTTNRVVMFSTLLAGVPRLAAELNAHFTLYCACLEDNNLVGDCYPQTHARISVSDVKIAVGNDFCVRVRFIHCTCLRWKSLLLLHIQ